MYAEFRQPRNWHDGSKGHACICYKGTAEYIFNGGSTITKALSNCAIGETIDFEDVIWFEKRTVFLTRLHNGWTFASQFPGKERAAPDKIFNEFDDKTFRTCLQQANTYSFWSHDLAITKNKDILPRNDMVCVSLEEYTKIKKLYDAFKECGPEPKKDHGFLIYSTSDTKPKNGTWVFDSKWNLHSIFFRSDMIYLNDSIIEDVHYVRPDNVYFK